MEHLILTAVIIFCISLVFSMFGRGGGDFYLPVIITLLGVPFYTAAGSSLFLILIQSISMVFIYSTRHRLLDWKLAFVLGATVAVAAFLGGFFSHGIPAVYLKVTFAVFLLSSAYLMVKRVNIATVKPGGFGVWHREFSGGSYDVNLLFTLLPVGVAAFLAGMVGISGGGLIIPLAVLVGGVPLRIAMGTNTFLVLCSSSMGFAAHALRGGVDLQLCLILGGAVLIASQVGSRLHMKVKERDLRRGFSLILVMASLWMIAKVFV
ncbi:MAG TPA: sulfite exporter TauE/SafE family protein [Dehalococcoidia bacterium]|nr:sulfite exporter TauE/SafE family protein [Dehalococcoidia bacterium]